LEIIVLKWIKALDLERWAETNAARAIFPALVGDLVRATALTIESFRFPSGDRGQVRGFDGHLIATGVPPYLPDGESIWEFGVSHDYATKFNKDFDNRVAQVGEADRAHITFVFATPWTWNNPQKKIQEWVAEKHALNKWKDVRFLDGAAFESWLEDNAAVASWYSRYELALIPQIGGRSIDEFWEAYSTRFSPTLKEEVLTCEREDQTKEFLARLASGVRKIEVRADSPDEVIAYVIAAIRGTEPAIRRYLEMRTLVVDTEEAAMQLAPRSNMIFIPRGTANSVSGLLAKTSPVVLALGRDLPNRGDQLVLARPSSLNLSRAIATMGFDEGKAYRLARESGRSVTILARRIPGGASDKPEWLKNGRTLVPAVLAGGWDAVSKADQEMVRTLAGVGNYDQYEAELRPMLKMQDPPIDRELSVWKVRAPVDVFAHLGHLVGAEDLTRLQIAARLVFSESDPSLDATNEEEEFSLTSRAQLQHSPWLRDGLATTLLVIASLHEEMELEISRSTPQRFVDELVANLPGLSSDYRMMASLRDALPLLMEAAPRPLLEALEHLLEGDADALKPIFKEGGGFFSAFSAHTYLLWALETIAWDPEYLTRVALILAKLAAIDPGGKTSNRPANSLVEIFLCWHPNTNASLKERLAALDYLIARNPSIGWSLISKLIPGLHNVAMNTPKPRYREAGASERERLTYGVVNEGYRSIIDRVLSLAGHDSERWKALLHNIGNFEPSVRSKMLILLEEYIDKASGTDQLQIWTVLRDEVNRHKAYPNARWAMPENELGKLVALVNRLEPSDPLLKFAWLFDDYYPNIPDKSNSPRDRVDSERESAIAILISKSGVDSIIQFAKDVKFPQFVAMAAGRVIRDLETFDHLIDASLGRGAHFDLFASALSSELGRLYTDKWNSRLIDHGRAGRWTSEQIATLLLNYLDIPPTWSLANRLGECVELVYWKRKTCWPLDGDSADLVRAARQYVRVSRVCDALYAIHTHIAVLPLDLVLELFEKAIPELKVSPGNKAMFLSHLGEMIEALSKRGDVTQIEVAKLEYAYLPLLSYREQEQTMTLHRIMAQEADFFVRLICDVFRPASAEASEATEEERARGTVAYRLLRSFKALPGARNGTIDTAFLGAWMREVRRLGVNEDRAVVADQYIGHVLAHSPDDPADGAWPHQSIRDLIEALDSKEIETGIEVERYNMRGVVTKGVYDGGAQERLLADVVRGWARICAPWSRTAALLNRMAKGWDAHAEREDSLVRQEKMRD
jgi:hypothetical protein